MQKTIVISCCIYILFAIWAAEIACEDDELPDNDCVVLLNKTATGNFKLDKTIIKGNCLWIIIGDANSTHISLFFKDLFLSAGDNVTLYDNVDDAKNRSKPLIEPIKAQNGSFPLVVNGKTVVIRFDANETSSDVRTFGGHYQTRACAFTMDPAVTIISSPVMVNLPSVECVLTFKVDSHHALQLPAFTFQEYNFVASSLSLEGFTPTDTKQPDDFFLDSDKEAHMTVKMNSKSDFFRFKIDMVNKECSRYIKLQKAGQVTLRSPAYQLNDGSIPTECRWVLSTDSPQVLGLKLNEASFGNVLDVMAINNGGREGSPPLLQLTTSSLNQTSSGLVRSSKSALWVAFKTTSFASFVSFNVTVHDQGGYLMGDGTFKMGPTGGSDTVFLLEVNATEVVALDFLKSSFGPNDTVQIYDGFDTTNLLTTLQRNPSFTVLSKSSRMTVLVPKFTGGFDATFKGVVPGTCMHMSTLAADNYVLSGNCNQTCTWIVPPQATANDVLLLDVQYVRLGKDESIEIRRLDEKHTSVGVVQWNVTRLPLVAFDAAEGARVDIRRSECPAGDAVAVVGHASYVPACRTLLQPLPGVGFQITSPNYPDTYPLLTNCVWNVSVPAGYLTHLAFTELKLAAGHCVKISGGKGTAVFRDNRLPDDLLLRGGSTVEFDSRVASNAVLASDGGFMLAGRVAECGDILVDKEAGEFNTSSMGNKTLCIWKVVLPEKEGTTSILAYSITMKEYSENCKVHVYDGASVREPEITNFTGSELWSRGNSLIVTYEHLDPSKAAPVMLFRYAAKSCDRLCKNKVCMHPDWRCDGKNDCGDFSDEETCQTTPFVPPPSGYTAAAFWTTAVILFVVGIVFGVSPSLYQRYKGNQYHHFADISVIE